MESKNNFLLKLYEKVTGKTFTAPFTSNPIKSSFEASCFILDTQNPYYHYFLAKENEKKENFVMICKSLMSRKFYIATSIFATYNFIKSLLWRQGYFAYFFFHTRNISLIMYMLSIYLIKKNFETTLINNNCFRYYEKREAAQRIEEAIKKNALKRQIISDRDDII